MKTWLSMIRENLLMKRKLQQNLKMIGSVNYSGPRSMSCCSTNYCLRNCSSRSLWFEGSSMEGESWKVGVSLRLTIKWKLGWKSTIGWNWKS